VGSAGPQSESKVVVRCIALFHRWEPDQDHAMILHRQSDLGHAGG
jgi:hypothetical protein